MAGHASKKVIYAALAGNCLIALTKFAASWYTGSSAMFSEAIHSLVDTGNQGLLLFGLKRAERKPDALHPFGYAKEIYFWAFVVAILIFAVGAGVSIYEGVHKIRHPEPVTNVFVNYIVLGLAILFESSAFVIALKEFNQHRGDRGFLQALREAKDPTNMTVLLEDSAAMLGLLVALVAIALGQLLDMPVLDGVASLLIGGILAVAAAILAYETKALLIGEAASPEVVERIRGIVAGERSVIRANEILTMHMGPRDVLVNLSVDFRDGLDSVDLESAVSRLERSIKAASPEITRVFIEAQAWRGHQLSRAPGDTIH
jgi:cation diffusion facilitator family transporter